ncbi:tetratricopeptide repeat protein [Pendulispora albinea]|uniref:Tetratricopeptide repeat protein n=1 Tax=Pendulispora albinea TaxID=2741071 RepID=A0ABZ2LPG2_9BACT
MPIDRESVLQTAQKYAEKKKYDRAILEYQKIIQVDPSDARTLLKMGDLQVKMGAYADSIATYERVGRHYVSLEFFVKAVWVYKQIGEILHKHVPHLEDRYAHIGPKLAELYQNLGLTSDALATLDEVATRLQKQQRDTEAIEVFKKTIELDPNNPIPHLRLAEALSRARDPEAAAAVFGTAASLLIKRGRPADALKVLERLLHHKQDPQQAKVAAELYLQRETPNDGLQALAKLQICFQANPKDLDTLALLARAFVVIGQADKGIEVRKEMARIAREQNKPDLFRRLVEELSRAAPDDEQVRQFAASLPAIGGGPPAASDRPAAREPGPAAAAPHELPGRAAHLPRVSGPIIESVEIDEELLEDEHVLEAEASHDDVPHSFDVPSRLSVTGRTSHTERINASPYAEEDDDYPEMSVEEADDLLVPANEEAIGELLEEAASLRRRRMYTSAIESLRIGLELDANSIELRQALRDVLIEAGRIDDAVDEAFALASLQLDRLDGEGAARSLSEILAFDPGNERAFDMLRELGYEAPLSAFPDTRRSPDSSSPPPSSERASSERAVPEEQHARRASFDDLGDLYDPDAPLPTYELDELGTGDIEASMFTEETLPRGSLPFDRRAQIPTPTAVQGDPTLGRRAKLGELAIDDPFGSSELPLPEFPLEALGYDGQRNTAPLDPTSRDTYADSPPEGEAELELTSRQSISSRPVIELEDALEEADFFASRGLYGDARAVLREQLSRTPNHPLLQERIQELEHQERGGSAQASGTRVVPASVDERSFDVAASLDALENLEEVTGPIDLSSFGQVDVEEVFAKFKEGVGKHVSVDEADIHYDLGIAYKEIGKVDDALREFQLAAAQGGARACVCESLIGQIHMERGALVAAIEAFLRGLQVPTRTTEQETMLSYELGTAYEQKNLFKEALGAYQRVARHNPNYRDALERVRRLSKYEPPRTSSRAVAVGAEDDEFDRAFDEIIGDGKLP